MLRRLVLLVAVLPLFAAAPAKPSGSAPPPSDLVSQTLQGMSFDQRLTLLEGGAAPRAVVRYAPRPGATATYEIVSRTAMDMSMTMPDGSTMEMPTGGLLPAVVMTTRNTVGERVANGLVPVRIEQLGARIEGTAAPGVAEGMRSSLAGIDKMSFQMFVDPAGKPVQLDVVGDANPAMADLVQQIADQTVDRMVVFPTEPIGTGARWKADLDMTMSGMHMTVAQTVTAKKITADGIDLDVVMVLGLGEGGFAMPGMPPGVTPEVTKFVGNGSGATHVDLTTLVATGLIKMDMDMGMRVTVPEQPPVAMAMAVHQTTEMRPVK